MSTDAIQTVFFDLDGTLVDTAPSLTYALNQLIAEYDQPPVDVGSLREIISDGTKAIIAHGLTACPGVAIDETLVQRYLDVYLKHITHDTDVFAEFDQVFAYLHQQQIAWGVVTNKLAWLSKPLLTQLNLIETSHCLVCGDEVEHPKPHPDVLLAASAKLGCEPQHCVYVGDAKMDVIAGQRAGMRTVVAGYGYIKANERIDTWGADHQIQSPKALIDYLASQ